MNWNEIKKFIRFHITNSKFGVLLANHKDITQPITEAVDNLSKTIQGKRNDIVNPEAISDPIVEAQNATTEAVKGIKIPEPIPADFSSLEAKIEALKETFEKKEMTVNVGKTDVNVDTKPFVKAIEKIEKAMPKMEKQEIIDYTLIFDEMCKIMERPHYAVDMIRIQETLGKLATTEDMVAISAYLQALIDKPLPEQPNFKFNKDGSLLVSPDKVGGGGGGGLTTIQENYLKGIDENTDGLETLVTSTNTKLDTLNAKDFSTEAKQDEQTALLEEIKALSAAVKSLAQSTVYPPYIDRATNNLRVQASGTVAVSTVSTLTGLTNIDGYQGKLQVINNNLGAWANTVRSRIS